LRQSYFAAASFVAAAVVALAPAHADERNPWNGLYVGLHGGYAWQNTDGIFDSGGGATDLSGINLNGAIIGGQLGYNYQSGQFLLGIEGDASALEGSDTVFNDAGTATAASLTGDMSYLASVRGRLGWAINNWLLFGSVGWGYANFKFSENAPLAPFNGTVHFNDSGLVYGGGVEWMLAYGVSVRGEFLRYDLGKSQLIPDNFFDRDPGDRVGFDNIDVARAALNIKLSQ
jgi:outer membrane immunogenic protein